MRRAVILLVLLMTLALALYAPLAGTTTGQTVPIAKLSVTVFAGQGNDFIFDSNQIVIPQVPIILNVTVINNGTTGEHTFSINDQTPDLQIDVVVTNPGDRGYVEFQVNESEFPGAIGVIYYNGSEFTPQRSAGGVRFYCRPHFDLGMIGAIVLASAGGGETPEKGFFLRAYWIGIIGIGAMLVWVGITYFVIKSSSRHFTDHHDHIRRGLP